MANINITKISPNTYQVIVTAHNKTSHEVHVSEAYARQLTKGRVSQIDLIKQSFEFLLARESNTSILRKFDLTTINRYFPEYETVIRQQLSVG